MCDKHSRRAESINQQCSETWTIGGKRKRCQGVFGSALGERDWRSCPACSGRIH